MKKLKSKLAAFKIRLTSASSEEPLNKLSLTAIIILDMIILNILFIGLNDHTGQLTAEHEYMPPAAQEIFIRQSWTPANRIANIQPLILAERNNIRYRYESPFDEDLIRRMHPTAQPFFRQVKDLSEDTALRALFLRRQKTVEERSRIERAFDEAKQSYDTQLLENIANASRPGVDAASVTAQQYSEKISRLTGEIRSLETDINAHPGIAQLWTVVSPGDSERDRIVEDYKRFQFWFPLKELLWQLLFLLPIFGIFYWWNGRSIRKDNPLQTLISSHLLVIASLPIILKVIELVIDLIPKHFFRNLFKFLKSLHLMALWHYFLIFVIITIGIALVCLIQRKVFNRQNVMQKRLMKGACTACGKRLPPGAGFCPFCGTGQLDECPACRRKTPCGGSCCIHCGTKRQPGGCYAQDI